MFLENWTIHTILRLLRSGTVCRNEFSFNLIGKSSFWILFKGKEKFSINIRWSLKIIFHYPAICLEVCSLLDCLPMLQLNFKEKHDEGTSVIIIFQTDKQEQSRKTMWIRGEKQKNNINLSTQVYISYIFISFNFFKKVFLLILCQWDDMQISWNITYFIWL